MEFGKMISKLKDRMRTSLSNERISTKEPSKLEDRQGLSRHGSSYSNRRTRMTTSLHEVRYKKQYQKIFVGVSSYYQKYKNARTEYTEALKQWKTADIRETKKAKLDRAYKQLQSETKKLSQSSAIAYGKNKKIREFERDISNEYAGIRGAEQETNKIVDKERGKIYKKYDVGQHTGAQLKGNQNFVVLEKYPDGSPKTIVSKKQEYKNYWARYSPDTTSQYSDRIFTLNKQGKIIKEVKQKVGTTRHSNRSGDWEYHIKPYESVVVNYSDGVKTPFSLKSNILEKEESAPHYTRFKTFESTNLAFNAGLRKKDVFGIDKSARGSRTYGRQFLSTSYDYDEGIKTTYVTPQQKRKAKQVKQNTYSQIKKAHSPNVGLIDLRAQSYKKKALERNSRIW